MFDKRIIRRNFNMVEVMLAVIVVALGIASTFVLFPVGLNASKDAVAESRVADISETAALIVQSEVIPKIVDTGDEKGYRFSNYENNENFCKRSDVFGGSTVIDGAIDPENPGGSAVSGTDLYRIDKGLFVYVSKVPDSGEVLFAAAVKVYLDQDGDSGFENEYFCTIRGNKTYLDLREKQVGSDFINKFLLPVAVEVSWPVTVPAADREKRVFRFELFNSEYDPGTDADAQKS